MKRCAPIQPLCGIGIHSYLVVQLEETNEHLAALDSETLSPSMLRAIQRHRELLQDNSRELKRTKVGSSSRKAPASPQLSRRLVSRTR